MTFQRLSGRMSPWVPLGPLVTCSPMLVTRKGALAVLPVFAQKGDASALTKWIRSPPPGMTALGCKVSQQFHAVSTTTVVGVVPGPLASHHLGT